MAAAAPKTRDELMPKLRSAFDFAQQQVRAIIEKYPAYYPMYTVGGKWGQDTDHWTHWCEGFLPGMMWMFARETKDPYWEEQARKYTLRLEERKDDGEVHDLGFLFLNTFGRWFRMSGDRKWLDVAVQAGRTLAKRWQPKGEYLCSFLGNRSLFIDLMMNIELIFLTAKATGDADLFDIARRHCRTTHRYLVREDGSTVQEGLFDPATGRFLRESTQFGWKPNSVWSRGLAWAIYGFGTAYHYTKDDEFLITAEECALFYLDRADTGLMVPWDFGCPTGPRRMADSSAAAVAANGFLNLAGMTKNSVNRARFVQATLTILDTLCSPHFLARGRKGQEGVLLHGVYHMPRNLGVDESVIWGDHYFVEALYKLIHEKKRTRPVAAVREPTEDEVAVFDSRTD